MPVSGCIGAVAPASSQTTPSAERRRDLELLFRPSSVAIIGASQGMDRIGGRPIEHMRRSGFRGAIYPVNPKYREIGDLRCYPSIDAVPRPIDLAVLAIAANRVEDTLRRCVVAGARAAIIFSAGFAELSDAGRKLQADVAQVARAEHIRILGPNCLGALDFHSRLMATFTLLDVSRIARGPIGFVSQSGLAGTYFLTLAHRRGMGFSRWIATGNEADVTTAECLACLAVDPATRVIAGFIEGIRDGSMFFEALSAAREHGKAVVLVKAGRSEAGARAAASHTGAMVGDNAVFDAVCQRYGAYRARDLDELVEITDALTQDAAPAGPRLGILTLSGGIGVSMADEAIEAGLELPALPQAAQKALRARVPYAPVENPVDLTGYLIHDDSIVEAFLDAINEAGIFDAVVTFLGQVAEDPGVIEHYLAASDRRRIPYYLVGVAREHTIEEFRRRGLPIHQSPTQAVRTIAALTRLQTSIAHGASSGPAVSRTACLEASRLVDRYIASTATAAGVTSTEVVPVRRVLGEADARLILAAAAVPLVPGRLAYDADDAARAAAEYGYPVVLKLAAATDVAHKTETGGVVLDVRDEAALRETYETLVRRARADCHGAIVRVLVEQMITDGVEVIVGVKRDPIFGPVLGLGAGGIYAEVLGDATVALCPVPPDEAAALIGRTRIGAILGGRRGRGPYDLEALARLISQVSDWAASDARVLEIDLNPVAVRSEGCGVAALDALIVVGE